MALLRDQRTDPKKFRELLREMAVLIAYEATADLAMEQVPVMTPLGQVDGRRGDRAGNRVSRTAGRNGI